MKVTAGLDASQAYRDALPEVVAQVVNGCGPGGWKFDIIPDTVLGLSIKEACNIHDWDYTVGLTDADKHAADQRFKRNCLAMVNNARGFWAVVLRYHRRLRVEEYYQAVRLFGDDAFWANKKPLKMEAELCTAP
ncbi:hypothetical protein KP003_16555 [Geomonas nitrogeniifigens]|uniref:hypothetical protein n=1 Tax=Geomonas diazotrophica TaxID=2843197 RepID=UPI001C2B97F1|nr:hypothetical protein [Geomonas nitrogeniifigens]QXE85952.1 hypothetical protein KP003_16555 [Geomonas nitrogeniifigens]